MPSFETICIAIVLIAALVVWVGLSQQAPRILMGLNTVRCPYCQELNSLDVMETGYSIASEKLPAQDTIYCKKCGKSCSYESVFPNKPEDGEPTPETSKAS